jgi:hypothetical protein
VASVPRDSSKRREFISARSISDRLESLAPTYFGGVSIAPPTAWLVRFLRAAEAGAFLESY